VWCCHPKGGSLHGTQVEAICTAEWKEPSVIILGVILLIKSVS
jgi:hypothetical protein